LADEFGPNAQRAMVVFVGDSPNDELMIGFFILGGLSNRLACLLANHGMVCIGPDLKKAAWLAVEVEALAAQYWQALQIGEPHVLPDNEIARVIAKFKDYGQGGDTRKMPSCC